MSEAPERVWVDYGSPQEYIRVDIVAQMVASGMLTYESWFEIRGEKEE